MRHSSARVIPGFKPDQTLIRGTHTDPYQPNSEKMPLLLTHRENAGFTGGSRWLSAGLCHLYQESIDTKLHHMPCQGRAG